MPVHQAILAAAVEICSERSDWRFRPEEIVAALAHLRPGTVRTHVTSRLCVNAPANHPHRWPYFRRVARGLYEILPAYRDPRPAARPEARPRRHVVAGEVPRPIRDTVHAVVSRDIGWYLAECLEIPVVAQGRTLDEVVTVLRAGVERRLATHDPAQFGLTRSPRVMLSYELRLTRAQGR